MRRSLGYSFFLLGVEFRFGASGFSGQGCWRFGSLSMISTSSAKLNAQNTNLADNQLEAPNSSKKGLVRVACDTSSFESTQRDVGMKARRSFIDERQGLKSQNTDVMTGGLHSGLT